MLIYSYSEERVFRAQPRRECLSHRYVLKYMRMAKVRTTIDQREKRCSSVNLAEYNILGTNDGHQVSNHMTLGHFVQRSQMWETWRTDF